MTITVAVTCTAFDQNGNPVAGGRFEAKLDRTETYQGFVVPELVQGVADEQGVCVLNLWPNALGTEGSSYRVRAYNPDTGRKYLDVTAVVPNSACRLEQIIVAEPYPAIDAAQQALIAAQAALAPVTAQAQAASESAAAAISSSNAASTSQGAAAASASAALASQQAAASSQSSASSSASAAASSAGAASAAASIATTKASEASTSASASAASAAASAGSATAALAQAGVATTKAFEASASAEAAGASAATAGAQASAAAAQASTATSQAAIATSQGALATAKAAEAASSALSATGSAATAADRAFVATLQAAQAEAESDTAASKAAEAAVSASTASTKAFDAAASAAAAEASRVQSGLDAQSTAADRDQVAANASAAAINAEIANTKAGEAAGAAAQALAIYGSAEAQQAAVAQAAAQASLAAGHAASAASVVQQDLSGVNAAALHRSPNAVTAMFIYDTSKDSDGGAWTEKCQGTSWYNEALNGKWLGAQASEANARNAGAILGTELVTNGSFDTDTAWTKGTGWTIAGGVASKTAGTATTLDQSISFSTAKIYRVSVSVSGRTGGSFNLRFGSSSVNTQNISANGEFIFHLAPSSPANILQFSADSSFNGSIDNVSVREVTAQTTQNGDYFQLTTDGKFYRLNATSGTTEVFRGNKADFPRLAAIVAEAANVTIYDLTEPGRPMWMRFVRSSSGSAATYLGTLSSAVNGIAAQSGVIAFSCGNPGGLVGVNFIKDSGFYKVGTTSTIRLGNVSQRNVEYSTHGTPDGGFTIANSACNAVAMTVLPDAPVDPVTGLRVPTIAVATGGGVSVIKHNGTVVNSSITGSFNWVTILPGRYELLGSFSAAESSYMFDPIGLLQAGFGARKALNSVSAPYINTAGQVQLKLSHSGSNTFLSRNASASLGVTVLRQNNYGTRGSAAYITPAFNTGHMTGDIRRAYLADVGAGSVSGPELVSNGTFDAGTTGWGANSFATISASGGTLVLTATAANPAASQAIATTAGKTYQLSAQLVTDAMTGATFFNVGTTSGAANIAQVNAGSVPGNYSALFVATGSTTHISVAGSSTALAGETIAVDNISVKEVVADRSYRARSANIAGTLTKTEVASAAQLVAYSGFSAANYLREPYSADLDFGTGEWSCSAWVNVPSVRAVSNYVTNSEQFNLWGSNSGVTVSSNVVNAPNGTLTADKLLASAVANQQSLQSNAIPAGIWSFSVYAKAGELSRVGLTAWDGSSYFCNALFDLAAGTVVSGSGARIESVGDGWYRCIVENRIALAGTSFQIRPARSTDTFGTTSGPFTPGEGIFVWGAQAEGGATTGIYRPTTSAQIIPAASIIDRSAASGANLSFAVTGIGNLTATAFDGTTTRTVTTTAAYNTATWLKARASYTTDGTLAISVNGVEVAATRGNPLLTLNNSNAVLTIGNSFALDAPFPGSLALVKFSATVPTAEQLVWMYEQEKQMFRTGAQVCLPDSSAIVDLSYDDATDKWIAVSSANESEWAGLVRTSVTPAPAGSYTRVTAASGVQLLARSTTSPGVDVTIPAYGLREELVKRAESAARLNAQLATLDYVGGFTANTTSGSTAITSVAGLAYPVSYIGARVSGSGIPANTTVVAVSGTTIYLSAAATATATGVQISFADFILPVGMEAKEVSLAGAAQREGTTAQYTRLFDGFKEAIRFGTAPSHTALVQIQAARSVA